MTAAARACLVQVTPDALDLQYVTDFVQDDSAGAIATFSGVTRNSFDGKKVIQLEYEAYGVMAEKVLQVCLISFTGTSQTAASEVRLLTVAYQQKLAYSRFCRY